MWTTGYFANFDVLDSYFQFGFGAAYDTTAANQREIYLDAQDAASPSVTRQKWSEVLVASPNTGTTNEAAISAIGSDGFTVNWTNKEATASRMEYACFGGADITNVKVGSFTAPTAGTTGNQATTGVGFQPDVIILFGTSNTATGQANGCTRGLGFATSSTNQVCNSGISKNAVATMSCKRLQFSNNSACYTLIDSTTTTNVGLKGSLVSLDADGFTINWTTVLTAEASVKIGYIAIKGGNWKCGAITAPTTGTVPVSQATTSVGFQPTGLILSTVGGTSSTVVTGNNHICFGGGSSSTDRHCSFTGDNDAVASAVTANINKSAKIVSMYTVAATHTSSTINAEADLTSLNTDGFTLSWTTRDTNAYEVLYLAAGNAQSAKSLYIAKAFFRADG